MQKTPLAYQKFSKTLINGTEKEVNMTKGTTFGVHSDSIRIKQQASSDEKRPSIHTTTEWIKRELIDAISPEITKRLSPIELMARFGLKTPEDMMIFLKTKKGNIIVEMIQKEIPFIAKNSKKSERSIKSKKKRLFLILLGLSYHKKKDKKLSSKTSIFHAEDFKNNGKTTTKKDLSCIMSSNMIVNKSIRFMKELLEKKISELQQLEREIHALGKDRDIISERYRFFQSTLDGVYHLFDLNTLPKPSRIESEIKKLEKLLDAQAKRLSIAVATDGGLETRRLMQEHNALQLKLDSLYDLLDIAKGKKKGYTTDGEETGSFQSAAFILRPEEKLVKSDGKYYLINAKQELSLMSSESKKHAEARFLAMRPLISSSRYRLRHHEMLEKRSHRQRLVSAKQRGLSKASILALKQEISLINEQIEALENDKKFTPSWGIPASTLHPRPAPSSKKRPFDETLDNVIAMLQKNPTKENIALLKKIYIKRLGNPGLLFLNSLSNQIVPGQPIPKVVLENLRTYAHQFLLGLEKTKADPRFHPTPYSTKPRY